MWVWRLAKARYARQLDGEGNRRTGARWNSPGRSVVYASEVLSLAILEMLVHTTAERLPKDLMAVAIEIPDHLPAREIALSDFPPGWESGQHDEWFRHTGDSWLSTAVEPCLIAPSVIVPEDHNVMLNPLHPAMAEVSVNSLRPFRLDARLVR